METNGFIFDSADVDSASFLKLDVTFFEKLILLAFIIFILIVLTVSGWSAFLLLTANDGGGPLELIANVLQIERVLS